MFLCACAVSSHAAHDGRPPVYAANDYFRNYAPSACLATGYESETVVADAAAAARAYLELGSVPLEEYAEATLLVKTYRSREYRSLSGSPLALMKCIDLFHSRKLDDLTRSWRKRKY